MGLGSENRTKRAIKRWLKMEELSKKGLTLRESYKDRMKERGSTLF